MEKSSKNTSSGSKGTTSSDGKAKQDGPNKYNRTSKHKENVYSRPEPARRPNPQRNRNAYDKRPRSRSGYATDRDRSEVAQIEKFEAISAIKQGSKKLSLNHLLNFTITPPRVANEYRSGSWQGGRNVRKQKLPKYNKEQFLQANCQFVVKEEGDYSNHAEDPDKLVDWDLVEEIHLPSHQVPSCPICLYPPVAAKITRCGHIYCWACLLHYLSLSDKTWRKCPICYEAVYKNDLKSVVSTSKTTYSVGDNITMCLMKRKRGSVISKPANRFSISENPISLNDEASCFQKLLTVSRGDVEKIINREFNELRTQLLKDKDVPEACFLESALELLDERKQSVMYTEVIEKDVFEYLTLDDKSETLSNTLNYNFQVDNHQIETMMDPFGDEEHEDNYYSRSENANKYSSALNEEQTSSSVDENVTSDINFSETSAIPSSSPKNNLQKQVKNQGKDYYYFYQAIDGQHIYLNALNVQMLVNFCLILCLNFIFDFIKYQFIILQLKFNSVVSTSKTTYSVGDNITMCLMKRKRGSVISKPANRFSISENPISLNDEASCFQKLLTVSRGDVEKIINREFNELRTQLLKDKDVPEACFLESALELLDERKQSVMYTEVIEKDVFEYLTLDDKSETLSNTLNYNFQVDNHQIETMMDPFGDEEHEDNYYSRSENANKYSSALNEEQTSSSVDENVTSDINFSETSAIPSSSPKNNLQKQVKNQGKDYYYFYQAIDGQHIYLNALNVQMLVRDYGSLEFCPHEITAKVVELEGVSMNELLRHRLRYLCHLPLTCEFQIVELQMKPLISPEVFDSFADELNKRDLMRKRKAKEERRRERHIEREENKRLGKFPGVKYHLDSMSHFPSCSSTSTSSVNLCTSDDPPLSVSAPENLSAEQLLASETFLTDKKTNDIQAVKNDNQPASFAQMLREGKTKPQSVSCSPPKDQNKLETQKSTVSTPNSEEDYYEPVPVLHRQSIGDAIQAALDNLNQHNPITENQETKKKKGRKTLLFSTSMNRRQ
ncbi:RING finger protein 10-like [Centruroides sculpturatus]|uniref:RING finger protein 10-like n=1 Tax=Centruroides sculpturatus TaxID=218467 RepID=UPI000C6CFF60|nr:RING finger protein 10-like [Centruroides sculpturatus]